MKRKNYYLLFIFTVCFSGFGYAQTKEVDQVFKPFVNQAGYNLTRRQAFWRYVYGSLWLLPCILVQGLLHLQKWQIIEMLFTVALFFWPLTTYLDRVNPLKRQSFPDRLANTRLVELPKNLVTLS